MTRQLRRGKGRTGLILANGGVMSYQHVICLSTSGRRDGSTYPAEDPLPEMVTDLPVPTVDAKVEGTEEATIEVSKPSLTQLGLFLAMTHHHHFEENCQTNSPF